MTSASNPEALRELRQEIENFLASLRHPVLVEDEVELLDLTASQWRVTMEPRGPVLEAWSPGRSIVRRIEQIAYRDRGRLGIFVRKPGGVRPPQWSFANCMPPANLPQTARRGASIFVANLLPSSKTGSRAGDSNGSATAPTGSTPSPLGTSAG